MLTYSKDNKPKRRDRPWLLFLLVIIWIAGTSFFHSPWEPYEPFVVAVVKSILIHNNWIVPYVAHAPYLEIQPFYFWIFASILKLFNVHNIISIANGIRIINTLLIFLTIYIAGRIGSRLDAFKNGRTTILILISTLGFIDNAYQISPNILILLGFTLYIYSLQKFNEMPGFSGCLLFIGLFFISLSFTFEFIIIALFLLLFLPIVDKRWRSGNYLYMTLIGITLFIVVFSLYCYQLFHVNSEFFYAWKFRYSVLAYWHDYKFLQRFSEVTSTLLWYSLPGYILIIWTCYKRRWQIFKDSINIANLLLIMMLLIFAIFSTRSVAYNLFPIVLPITFLASLEIDSIRMSISSLFNWFSIFIFGLFGLVIWCGYFILLWHKPLYIYSYLISLTDNYHYNFNIWQLMLAIIITIIWLFMITRRHLRGREVVSNWASGTTYVLILFMAVILPWFDAVLTFKNIVHDSVRYLTNGQCIATNGNYSTQQALWYYYENISLMPVFVDIDYTVCNQAVIATDNINKFDLTHWKIVWVGKRAIDKKAYYVIWHK